MSAAAALILLCALPGTRALQDFDRRITGYLKIHKAAEAGLPKLKPTASPEQIKARERVLCDRIRRARAAARHGDIFTPAIAAEFRRLIAQPMRGPAAARVHQSLHSAEPVKIALQVNQRYPDGVPLQSTPPTLLLNLPKLPDQLRYEVVDHALVLHDTEANLVIDFLTEAIP